MWDFLATLVWPALIVGTFYHFRESWPKIGEYIKSVVDAILKREDVDIEFSGFKMKTSKVTVDIGKQVTEIQSRIASIESRFENNFLELPTNPTHGNARKILWVDDFPSNNAFLIDRFRSQDIETVIAISTEHAMKLILSEDFSLVISDLGRIENGNENPFAGLDLIKSIRENDIDCPIAIFSGHRGIEHRRMLMDAGADGVFDSGVDVIKFVTEKTGRAS
ncbi:response regulator [Phreatobacter sp. HK31-P]